MGWMWECPDYFETDGKGIIVFSPMGFLKDEKPYDSVAICALADFCEETGEMNISDNWQLIDCGEDLYAPQSNVDKDGNRVIIAWARMPEPFEKIVLEYTVFREWPRSEIIIYISVLTQMRLVCSHGKFLLRRKPERAVTGLAWI